MFSRIFTLYFFKVQATTFETVEAQFTNGQTLDFPKNGILIVDPPIFSTHIKVVLKSGSISGLGKITLKSIGELVIVTE